jgi:hypothetical protein
MSLTQGKVQVLEREILLLYYDFKIAFVVDLYSSTAAGLVIRSFAMLHFATYMYHYLQDARYFT